MSEAINTAASRRQEAAAADDKNLFGFWVYLMTDCILFASLFATFAVLRHNTFGGPGGSVLFSLPFVLAETLILLTSSFSCGLGILAARQNQKDQALLFMAITFILGAAFLGLELHEFTKLAHEGNSWRRSGFLSAFFTLVGTHGLHITSGLVWLSVMLPKIRQKGLNRDSVRKLTLFSLFWHFLDIIWLFIFSIVYLFGVVQ
jgi:cytochrome o ubiquinol oxidase subunit III